MTVVSTPACSRRIAAVWRKTWGDSFFVLRDGKRCAATLAWRVTMTVTA